MSVDISQGVSHTHTYVTKGGQKLEIFFSRKKKKKCFKSSGGSCFSLRLADWIYSLCLWFFRFLTPLTKRSEVIIRTLCEEQSFPFTAFWNDGRRFHPGIVISFTLHFLFAFMSSVIFFCEGGLCFISRWVASHIFERGEGMNAYCARGTIN